MTFASLPRMATNYRGEDAANAINYQLDDQPHVTSPWLRAYTKADRDSGMYRQEALAFVFPDDLPHFDAALKDILDPDERWVMIIRAMGTSRESFLADLSGAERLRFLAGSGTAAVAVCILALVRNVECSRQALRVNG